MEQFRLDDGVWHRVVQIVQEAMLTGVDCADLLRQVRVEIASTEPNVLVLTEAYKKQTEANYEKLVADANAHMLVRNTSTVGDA